MTSCLQSEVSLTVTTIGDRSCPCGQASLPVSMASIEVARKYPWYRLGPQFRRIYYRVLERAGIDRDTTSKAIHLLSQHRKCRGVELTAAQVRGAWGLEKGIFGNHGVFVVGALVGNEVEAALLDDTDEGSK